MENPLVSIIIPVYNRADIVHRSIESALSQTYSNIEIVVNDNASTDNTFEIINEYANRDSRVKVFQNTENLGPVKNWVACLNHVAGEYVKILWSDDTILPNFIEETLPPLVKDESIGFAYSAVRLIKNNGEFSIYRWGDSGKYQTSDFIESSILNKRPTPISPGCALFRTKDVKKNLLVEIENPYNLTFSRYGAGNDELLFLLPCVDYSHFYFIENELSIFYGGGDSLSLNNKLSQYYAFAKFYFVKNFCDRQYLNIYCTRALFSKNRHLVKNVKYSFHFRTFWKLIIRRIKIKLKLKQIENI